MRRAVCDGTVSVRLSVCLSIPFVRCSSVRWVCCCGLGGYEISIDCCTAVVAAARRTAANAGSATLSAYVVMKLYISLLYAVAYGRKVTTCYCQLMPVNAT